MPISQYQETISRLQALGIHSVLVQFCDIHGVAKGKLVPLSNLQEWVEQGAGFAGPRDHVQNPIPITSIEARKLRALTA